MNVTLKASPQVVTVNGSRTWVWSGRTDSGIEVTAFIARLTTPADTDARFRAELEANGIVEADGAPAKFGGTQPG